MIDGLKPYPTMKESGVPWIGDIPEHWTAERSKTLFRRMDRAVRDGDQVVTCFRDGTVTLRSNRRVSGFTEALQEAGYQGIRTGDLVIHAMDAFAGAIGVSDSDGKGTPVYAVCTPTGDANSFYYAHLLREMARSGWIQALARGIRERSTDFRYDGFSRQSICVPPADEQRAIVRFIDHADTRIRRYIRAKQKLIKLLEEQKQAIIHRAVTRGTELDPPTRRSGIEGFGELPACWDVRRAKFVFQAVDVRSETGAEELLTVSSRDGVVPRAGGNVTMFMAESYVGHKLCWPDDLVINSLWAWAGGLGFSRHHGIVSTAYGVYRLRGAHAPLASYLDLALRSGAYDWQFQVRSKGIWKSRLQLTDAAFLDMPLALPPVDEAAAICEAVATDTTRVRAAITKADREIELLKEYRIRLIADVVTGKVDVREAAAALPDVTDAIEEIEDIGADGDIGREPDELGEAPEEIEAWPQTPPN